MMIIGITGGIGSGKSVVAQMLRAMGHKVYDSDSEAKRLMNTSPQLRQKLMEAFGSEIYRDGTLDSKALAAIIFNRPEARGRVNAIVHPAVKEHMLQWARQAGCEAVWVETAILRESGLDAVVGRAWIVEAPLEVRIARVESRDSASRKQIEARIASQSCDLPYRCPTVTIVNDNRQSVSPVLHRLLSQLNEL